jgi:hypothetical protein
MAANTVKVNATGATANAADLAMPASTMLARLASGDIVAADVAQIKALLAYVAGDITGVATSPLITVHAPVTITGTGETSIFGSYSVAGGTLGTDYHSMRLEVPFTLINNSGGNSTLTVRVKVAGTNRYSDVSAPIATDADPRHSMLVVRFIRTSSTTCWISISLNIGNAAVATTGDGDLGSADTISLRQVGATAVPWTWANSTALDVTFTHSVTGDITTAGAPLMKNQ